MTRSPFRILVAVTFHFSEVRLQYLFQVVRAFSEYPVEAIDVVVVTNVDQPTPLKQIRDLLDPLFEPFPLQPTSKKGLSVESHPRLPHPFFLTWSHKPIISNRFLGSASDYTHFIYVEDDILLSFENFCYFVHFRNVLKSEKLIPSFQRIEYSDGDNRLHLLDQDGVSDFSSRKRTVVDGYAFVNLDHPYNAMFILDRELAREYVETASFDRDRSEVVQPKWDVRERAAMGLCFENPPPGFAVRYVSPVNPSTLATPCWSWVYHLTNNYTKDRLTPFGKTRIDHLFGPSDSITWRPPSRFTEYLARLRRQIGYLVRALS